MGIYTMRDARHIPHILPLIVFTDSRDFSCRDVGDSSEDLDISIKPRIRFVMKSDSSRYVGVEWCTISRPTTRRDGPCNQAREAAVVSRSFFSSAALSYRMAGMSANAWKCAVTIANELSYSSASNCHAAS